MQSLKALTNLHSRIDNGIQRFEFGSGKQILPELEIPLWTQLHDVAEIASLLHGQILRPQESFRKRAFGNVVFEVPVEPVSWLVQIPLQCHLLSTQFHEIDNTLSTSSKFLDYSRFRPIGQRYFFSRFQF